VPELLIAVSWTLATGFGSFLPYLYPLFLAMLLLDRVGRDDRRCHAKYGSGWEEYRRAVPRRLLPGVY
jgi:protein-S-isoprenylcysteine O-methyltransferase Ste14